MGKRRCCAALALACTAAGAQPGAPELAQVLAAVPVVQDVAVPRQLCGEEQVLVQQSQNTGTGAFLGSVAGGVAGNQFGSGDGRAWATLLGAVAGAFWGDRAEGQPAPQTRHVRRCTMVQVAEPQVVGYDVRYVYAGRHYQARMPHDPGPTLAVQVTPVAAHGVPVTQPPVPAAQRQPDQRQWPRVGGED